MDDPGRLIHMANEFEPLGAAEVLARAAGFFGQDRIALASSFSAADQVILDLLCRGKWNVAVFTLDTGRLNPETYDTIAATIQLYGKKIEILFPEREAVESFVHEHGPNAFRQSRALREECCRIRKVEPLQRRLKSLDAWITGLRREDSRGRSKIPKIEWDAVNGLAKVNPLADWTDDRVWDYARRNNLPLNPLYNEGYQSIGCAPCTRAAGPGEDPRAGRWWWESSEHKECGLHRRLPPDQKQ